jgi:hypothetical protein
MSTDPETIPIELDFAERQVLQHLLDRFIHSRVWEAVRYARGMTQLDEAAEQVRRLARLQEITGFEDATIPASDAVALRADLVLWAMETETTIEEAGDAIVEADDAGGRPREERDRAMENTRETMVIDYAHKAVCERIILQIDAAGVPA